MVENDMDHIDLVSVSPLLDEVTKELRSIVLFHTNSWGYEEDELLEEVRLDAERILRIVAGYL